MMKSQTAATLTFCTYLMAMYPDITKRLREEVLEKVGIARSPTYDDIRDMKFLRAFINGEVVVQISKRQNLTSDIFGQRRYVCIP